MLLLRVGGLAGMKPRGPQLAARTTRVQHVLRASRMERRAGERLRGGRTRDRTTRSAEAVTGGASAHEGAPPLAHGILGGVETAHSDSHGASSMGAAAVQKTSQ